jgi:hypothetical protein
MAELLASGSKKISQLTSVSGISGSTAMPIVMGGNTVQVSHTDFLTSTVFSQPNTFTEVNEFTIEQRIINNGSVTDLTGDGIIIREDIVSGPPTYGFRISSSVEEILFQDIVPPIIGNPFNTFLKIATNSGPITIFRNTTIDGDLKVDGNLIATQYILSSSVSHITSSFSSGSTIFGDTIDDTHQFTGSISANGNVLINGNIGATGNINTLNINALNVTAQSLTGSLNFTNLTNRPTLVSSSQQVISLLPIGTVSGSSQISFNGIVDKPTLFSSSIQVNADTITNFDANVLAYNNSLGVVSGSTQVSFNGIVDKPTLVSGSTQVISLLPNGTVSGSSQVSFTAISNRPTLVSGSSQITYSGISSIPTGIVSSSTQVLNYGIFATTGSNTFRGNQIVTGSFNVTGSLNIDNKVRVENGFSILTSVSQSLEFVDDTAAAAGGVPLGGLYRSGNFILIRLT